MTIRFSEQNGLTRGALFCRIYVSTAILCICMCTLLHNKSELLTMDYHQKTLKNILVNTSYYSQKLSIKYLHQTVLTDVCLCISISMSLHMCFSAWG